MEGQSAICRRLESSSVSRFKFERRLTFVKVTTALSRMEIDQLLQLSTSIDHSSSFSDESLENERNRIGDNPEEVDQALRRDGHD